MESSQLLTVLVLAVGMIHLMATVGRHISEWWAVAFGQRTVDRQESNPLSVAVQHRQADDWYVFFHCSTFILPEEQKAMHKTENKSIDKQRRQRSNTAQPWQPRARARA